MGIKATLIKPWAYQTARSLERQAKQARSDQERIWRKLIQKARYTAFGKEHDFKHIRSYADYLRKVPVMDYEGLRPYIERIIAGEKNVLWPGRPRYLAKTSGTTSGIKYIPITKDSLPNHFGSARKALFNYFAHTGKGGFLDGKVIFLSGSPELESKGGIPTGRLSGIANHLVPAWLRSNQLPSYKTNCINDWESKVDAIVAETRKQDLRLISGIPPWVQMYYERLLEQSGKKSVLEVFPHFHIFVHGGVNYEPYRPILETLVGGPVDSLETYPASEGFIAFQDIPGEKGLLLNTCSGIFFDFIPMEETHRLQNNNGIYPHAPRIPLSEVKTGRDYAIVLSSNAGLWSYLLGDTVRFLSTNPYRLVVSGRIKHFISAFGEHVIGKEVEQAIEYALRQMPAKIVEFTVAPQVHPPDGGMPYHEWFIAFEQPPQNLTAFAKYIDDEMQRQNIYYQDLIKGKVLQPLKIRVLPKNAFRLYMQNIGKLGGQNKVPRLANNRKIADKLQTYLSD